jgi:hypothetical protein
MRNAIQALLGNIQCEVASQWVYFYEGKFVSFGEETKKGIILRVLKYRFMLYHSLDNS